LRPPPALRRTRLQSRRGRQGPAQPLDTRPYGPTRGSVVSPNTLTNGVPKVPEGCSEGFCHFWHLVTLGFRETYDHLRNVGETAIEGWISRKDTLTKCLEDSGHSAPRRPSTNRPSTVLFSADEISLSLSQRGCQKRQRCV
jgi:hypothetical protein